jgi:hypothetical protein
MKCSLNQCHFGMWHQLVSAVLRLFEMSVWFQMTTAMFCSWTDTVRVWCVQDEWNSLGNCLREYSQTLKEMGCRYIEQMLVHCMEGRYSEIRTSDISQSIQK